MPPPPWVLKKSVRAMTSTPGTVMCAPMRYSTRHRKVKVIFCHSSGVRYMFWTAEAALFCAMLLLDAAPGRFDLCACASTHPDTANGDGARQIAICQHLGRTLSLVDQSDVGKSLLGHFHSLGQTVEIVQPNDLMLNAKDIRETPLWQPPCERHLATLELRLAST